MADQRQASVTLEPDLSHKLYHGVSQLVGAIRPTLGPTSHLTAVQRSDPKLAPELLDDGGTIARRVIELPDRDENVGAMLLRNLLCRLHDDTGDGTATAAVLFESMYRQGLRAIAAGASPEKLARHLKLASQLAVEELNRLSESCTSEGQLGDIAASVGADGELARVLAETLSVIGRFGRLEIQNSYDREIRREYHEGHHWRGRVASSSMLDDHGDQHIRLERPLVLTSDLDLRHPQEVVPVVVQSARNDQPLLLIAKSFSSTVISVLLANQDEGRRPIVAVKSPGTDEQSRRTALEDIVHIVGGRAYLQAAGDRLTDTGLLDFGAAQRAWVFPESFAVAGGKGSPRQLRLHIDMLARASEQAVDTETQRGLQERIGTLQGSTATIWIGGRTENEAKLRRRLAEQAATVLRGVMAAGVVPGGGAALYSCQRPLRDAIAGTTDDDARIAYQIVHEALAVPLRTIIHNAGVEPAAIVDQIERSGADYGFDARTGKVVDMTSAGIIDPVSVLCAALSGATSAAAIALTIGVAVHSGTRHVAKNP